MCGLTGILNCSRDQTADALLATVTRMANTLRHRGPDDSGAWCDPAAGIALGFQRLSIVDLTPAGHQPMVSSCGRFVIVFNGEIYNANELRRELAAQGSSFRGHSDTEVLAEGFATWGIEATVTRCLGMFAIAVWNTQRRELTLIRDRLGKKPLYYGRFGSTLLFGSETKALRAHPAFEASVNRPMLGQFLKYSYLPGGSIYNGVSQLRPGSLMTISLDDNLYWSGQRVDPQCEYWTIHRAVELGLRTPNTESFDSAASSLDTLLTDAVGRRMVADVSLGAFLSGGIDSSLVVALMQKQSSRPVKTFTIGFEEEAYNEAPFAARVASHLKTDHTELYVTAQQARDVIPLLPTIFDEPFADSSQIPTFLVSQLARQHVTVALSGDGGDELFCGYRRYFEAFTGHTVRGLERLGLTEAALVAPQSGASRLAALLRSLPASIRGPLGAMCRTASQLPLRSLATNFRRAAEVLGESGPDERYLRNMSHWRATDQLVIGGEFPDEQTISQCLWPAASARSAAEFQACWQWYDTWRYLPDDILTKVDRTSMAISLEARTPLLDHRVVEFAWTLPHEFKVADGQGKRILRSVLSRYVPTEMFERPKLGFGVPIDSWLRGPLRDWAEDLLDEGRLKREGYLNPRPIRQKWSEHLSGRADWHYLLWDVLMFQAWLAAQSHRSA